MMSPKAQGKTRRRPAPRNRGGLRQLRPLGAAALVLAAMFALSACGFPWGGGAPGAAPDGGAAVPPAEEPGGQGGPGETDDGNGTVSVDPAPTTDEVTVTLYFADFQAQYVMPEERTIQLSGQESLVEAVVREFLAGPEDPHLYSAYPDTARLISAEAVDGVALVNFEEGLEIHGTAGQTMAVRSLVFTLTDLEDVDEVQLLVGGRAMNFEGHAVLADPIGRGAIVDYPVFVDDERTEWLQAEVDAGRQTWRKDPLAVAKFDGRMFGFTGDEDFKPIDSAETNSRLFEVAVDGETYVMELLRAFPDNPDSIWVILDLTLRQ